MDDAQLWRLQHGGDRRAHTELVERYLPLARSQALRYRGSGEPIEDLVQVASVGLLKALRRWDPDRGFAFSSFAVPTILGELRRYFRDSTWAVRPPRGTQELALVVAKAHDQLSQERSRPPSVAELAGRLGRGQGEVLDALEAAAARHADSLDVAIVEDDEATTWLDLLGESEPGYGHVESALTLGELTSILDARACEVLRLRFVEDMLQRDIAERVGCSQMQVSRIVRDSMSRLQRYAGLRRARAIPATRAA